jgi:hypothetical protein
MFHVWAAELDESNFYIMYHLLNNEPFFRKPKKFDMKFA